MYELISFLYEFEDASLFIARAIFGSVMLYYGYPKIKDLRKNAKDFEKMGFKPGIFFGTIVACIEFFGGLGVITGLFVQLIALAFGFQMLMGAMWKIKQTNKPFTDWSYDLALLAGMIFLFFHGPGSWSL